MSTYLITYDLNSPGQGYGDLFHAIKSLANGWWHHLDSTWLINSNSSAADIRDRLLPFLDNNDELLVIAVGRDWATYGLPQGANQWLQTQRLLA